MIRVLVVDDHAMLLEGVQLALSAEADIDVVSTATSVASGLHEFRTLSPEVVVTDYRIGAETGADLARSILLIDPSARVVAVSALSSADVIEDVIAAGCVAFVEKRKGIAELLTAIRVTTGDATYFPRRSLDGSLGWPRTAGRELSPRELEVLQLLGHGLNATKIAEDLNISIHTVRNHTREILRKLGASSQLEAVVRAMSEGIVAAPGPAA